MVKPKGSKQGYRCNRFYRKNNSSGNTNCTCSIYAHSLGSHINKMDILMRIFTIRRGKFVGEHKIYDSVAEAKKDGIVPIVPWYSLDVVAGEWVVADDGFVVQCLDSANNNLRMRLINKRHRSGQYTDCFRFPQGTFGVYYDAKHKPHINKSFYAMSANSHKSSLGNTSGLGKYMTIKKREFVLYMSMGYDPYTSYVKAYKVRGANPNHITIQINKLLTDPIVKEALMEALKPFMEQVQKKVRKLTGHSDLNQLMVEQVSQLITTQPKSYSDRMTQAKFTLEIFGVPLGAIASTSDAKNKKGLNAEEIAYSEVPPVSIAMSTSEQKNSQ